MGVITVRQASKMAYTCEHTIRRLCEAGAFPASNVGTSKRKQWRIDEETFIKWLKGGPDGRYI